MRRLNLHYPLCLQPYYTSPREYAVPYILLVYIIIIITPSTPIIISNLRLLLPQTKILCVPLPHAHAVDGDEQEKITTRMRFLHLM